MQSIHKTVLLNETIQQARLKPGMTVVDATLGGGGHSLKILQQITDSGLLIALDKDSSAIRRFEKVLNERGINNATLINDSFENLANILSSLEIQTVDAIVADLGISSDQLDDAARGMSFLKEGPLDMRMNQLSGITAAHIIATYSENQLMRIFREYGDEPFAKSIAAAIARERTMKPIESTSQLVSVIAQAVPEKYKHGKIHWATRTFQALRIEVNRELEGISPFLSQAIDVLACGGRMAVITFHSGEDTIVKHVFRDNARGCICPPALPLCRCGQAPKIKIITKKPIVPTAEEITENPRSRSAKLRVVEKLITDN